jgi:hypothetical protein
VPLKGYFKGKGEEVMGDMKSQYGAKKGKEVFYATANKKKMAPKKKGKKRKGASSLDAQMEGMRK